MQICYYQDTINPDNIFEGDSMKINELAGFFFIRVNYTKFIMTSLFIFQCQKKPREINDFQVLIFPQGSNALFALYDNDTLWCKFNHVRWF